MSKTDPEGLCCEFVFETGTFIEGCMRIHIEYLGVSRLVTQKKAEELELPDGITFRGLVQRLGETYPGLIGYVIQPGTTNLQPPNILNIDGKRMVRGDQMDDLIADGDNVILMSMSAGG